MSPFPALFSFKTSKIYLIFLSEFCIIYRSAVLRIQLKKRAYSKMDIMRDSEALVAGSIPARRAIIFYKDKSGYSSAWFRALASGARGRAFKSHYPDHFFIIAFFMIF